MAREKGTAGSLQLPTAALAIINMQPRYASNPYVFATKGDFYIQGVSRSKSVFDKKAGVTNWTIYDLRRTARPLMSCAGVRPDIAERVIGHAIRGVESVYDRHAYSAEKAHALNALAGLIHSIVNPTDNVVALRG